MEWIAHWLVATFVAAKLPFLGLAAGTLLVPDEGEVELLKFALGVKAQENQVLVLFASNTTPAEGDTVSTYTAAAGGGYADINLTGSSWTVGTSGGVSTASYAQQTFTFTGALTTNPTVYGYLVKSTTGGKLLFAERLTSSFTPANNGDTVKITPQLTGE